MARLSRITVPDLPHHLTQRGNRRQLLIAEPGDYALYRDLLAGRLRQCGVVCWGYCLMPDHVHLILPPPPMRAPCRAVGEAHRRYAGFVNARARVTGRDDALVSVAPALQRAPRFADLLVLSLAEQMALEGFEPKSANGRPLGPPAIVAAVEAKLGRSLQPS